MAGIIDCLLQTVMIGLNLASMLSIGIYYFEGMFSIIVGITLAYCVGMYYFYRYQAAMNLRLSQFRDRRINYLKNVYNSIRYVKSRAIETWIFKNLQAFRQPELRTTFVLNRFKSVVIFVCICVPPAAITVFLVAYVHAGLIVTVTKMSLVMRVLGQLTGLIWQLPANMFDVMSAYNSVTRLTAFLQSVELQPVSKLLGLGEQAYAAIVEKAVFSWQPSEVQAVKELAMQEQTED